MYEREKQALLKQRQEIELQFPTLCLPDPDPSGWNNCVTPETYSRHLKVYLSTEEFCMCFGHIVYYCFMYSTITAMLCLFL